MVAPRLQTSSTQVAIIDEVVQGVFPATPAMQILRFTGEGMDVKRDTKKSQEMNAKRNVKDLVVMKAEASGNVKGELSYGTYDKIMQSALFGTWTADVLKNDLVYNPFSAEVLYNGSGTDDIYKRFSGCLVSKFMLDIKAGEFVTVTADIMGRSSYYSGTALTGATYLDSNTERTLTGAEFGSITLGTLAIDCINRLTLDVNNNLRAQHCLGTVNPTGIGYGELDVTGELDMYLTKDQLPTLQAFINNDRLPISFVMGVETLKKYQFDMDIKLSDVKVSADQGNQDVMIKAKYQAIEKPAAKTSLTITRAVV
jgi:hypothetical protein